MRLTPQELPVSMSSLTRGEFPFEDIEMLIRVHQSHSLESQSTKHDLYENYNYEQLLTLISEFDLIIRRMRILVKSFYSWADLNATQMDVEPNESIPLFSIEFLSSLWLKAEDFDSICSIRKSLLKVFAERDCDSGAKANMYLDYSI